MRVLVLLALAGCGRLGFDSLSDALAPDDDLDGDLVADASDNCPIKMNADQANEDGDRFGDVCDPCPPIADGLVIADQDGDGVADACDPRPSLAGEVITVFEGFTSPPSGATIDGTWSFANGQAIVTSSPDELSALTWTIAGQQETVRTFVTIDALFGNLTARPVGVVHEFAAASADGLMCVFGVNPSNSQVVAIADNRTTAALASSPTTATVGSSRGFASRRDAGAYQCTDTQGAMLNANSNLASSPNRAGLVSRSVSARFDWVMIVTTP